MKTSLTIFLSAGMLIISGCANNSVPQIPLPNSSTCNMLNEDENATIYICQNPRFDFGEVKQADLKIDFKKPIAKSGYDNIYTELTKLYFQCPRHQYAAKTQIFYDKDGRTIGGLETNQGLQLAVDPAMIAILNSVCKELSDNFLNTPPQ